MTTSSRRDFLNIAAAGSALAAKGPKDFMPKHGEIAVKLSVRYPTDRALIRVLRL
jgi:hypothetical protein